VDGGVYDSPVSPADDIDGSGDAAAIVAAAAACPMVVTGEVGGLDLGQN